MQHVFRRIAHMSKPHRKYFYLGLTMIILANATRLIAPLVSRGIVDDVIQSGLVNLLPGLCLALLGLTAVRAVSNYTRGVSMERLSQNFVFDLRTGLYNHLQEMPYKFFDDNYVGEIMSRMTGDIEGLRNLLANGIVQVLDSLMWFFGSLIMLFTLNAKLALLLLAVAPVVAVVAYFFRKKVRPAFRLIREQNAVLSTKTQENISGIRVVKAYASEAHEKEEFRAENRKVLDLNMSASYIWSDFVPVLDFLGAACTPLLLAVGGMMVIRGEITLGTLVAFTNYIWMITGPMRSMGNIVNMLAQSSTSAEKLFYYVDLGPSIRNREETQFPKAFKGHVQFDHVSFTYGDGDILTDINLDVPAGTTCAVMGATGTGKTSIVNMLGRFYECKSGAVKIDGVDVKDMPLKALRDRIGYVAQETFLFSESILENVRFGRPQAEMPQVERATHAAQAEEFIANTPDGYETIVGERGMGLSGGQKQRLAIARALCYEPTILVLDDSTSAVDMETEYEIQKELKTLMKDRTTFIIAHRISSVRNADQIIVLKDGRIAERGKHEELLALKGLYYNMFTDQYKDFASMEGQVG